MPNIVNLPFLKFFLLLMLGLSLNLGSGQAQAQSSAQEMGLTNYEYFVAYPHLDKAFKALEENNQQRAIGEFKKALEIAPGNTTLILYVVEAYRHFNDESSARAFLQEQMPASDNPQALQRYLDSLYVAPSPIHTADDLAEAAKHCEAEPTPECRARVAYAGLQLEQLSVVIQQLQDEDFRSSDEGAQVEKALLQRALFLEQWSLADEIFYEQFQERELSAQEYNQWLNAILLGQLDNRFIELQQANVFTAPENYIQFAAHLLGRNEKKELKSYLLANHPEFQSELQEQSWVYLLMSAGENSEELLKDYRAQYPENKEFIATQLLPFATAANEIDYLEKILADLPADRYLQERYNLSISQGDRQKARALARKIYEDEKSSLEALDTYTWRLQQLGRSPDALQTLLQRYPFQGEQERVYNLTLRTFSLAQKHEDLLDPKDKQYLLEPLGQPALRELQVQLPWAQDNCDAIVDLLGDYHQAYKAHSWALLGECYRKRLQGIAVHAFQQAVEAEPTISRTKALAYQQFEVKDYDQALQAWKAVPMDQMNDDDLQAATLTAELAGDSNWQLQLLSEQKRRGLDNTHNYALSLARYYLDTDPDLALHYLDRSIEIKPTGLALSLRANIYRQRNNLDNAYRDLLRAIELEPDNRLYAASFGYLLWDKEQLAEAKSVQEYALVAMPDDIDLLKQLSYVSERLDRADDAQKYIKRVVDDLDYQAEIKPLTREQKQERFDFRRMHEEVGRKWTFNFDANIGLTSNTYQLLAPQERLPANADENYNSFAQVEAEYRIGKNAIVPDDMLSVYGRVMTSTDDSSAIWPAKAPMLGLGLRWKPWRERVIFAAIERLIPLDHKGRTDTLVRLSGSFFNGGKYSDDWHPGGSGWFAQNLYLDGAHYINDNRQSWVADYRVSWHQKIQRGQTLEPYARVQTQGFRGDHGTNAFHGVGAGLRWNIWLGETRYDAWPHKLSIGLEVQHVFKTVNADSKKRNNLLLTFGLRW